MTAPRPRRPQAGDAELPAIRAIRRARDADRHRHRQQQQQQQQQQQSDGDGDDDDDEPGSSGRGGRQEDGALGLDEKVVEHACGAETRVLAVPVVERGSFASDSEFTRVVDAHLEACKNKLDKAKEHQLGYPINQKTNEELDFSALTRFQGYKINNVGDPASGTGIMQSHTHGFELGVLQWFGELWDIDCDKDLWGYITTGGTESNLQALYVAREVFPQGILYTSRDSHFSILKAAHLLRMEAVVIDSDDRGVILYDQLEQQLEKNAGRPAIVNVNFGTTMVGGIDDPNTVASVLERAGYSSEEFYMHVDAALSGIFVPLLRDEGAPVLSFRETPIASAAISGHKFLGCPFPCGVVAIKKKYIENIGNNVEYIFSKDVTLTCSRNGHAALYLWYMLCQLGTKQIREDAQRCIRYAQKLQRILQSKGIYSWVNPFSITVVFERPKDMDFVKNWQIACQGDQCHVVVMPHLTWDILEIFANELIRTVSTTSERTRRPLETTTITDQNIPKSAIEECQKEFEKTNACRHHCFSLQR